MLDSTATCWTVLAHPGRGLLVVPGMVELLPRCPSEIEAVGPVVTASVGGRDTRTPGLVDQTGKTFGAVALQPQGEFWQGDSSSS